ncbi:hypothetical protein [Desulfotruncus alcoholivorax]|uniref:hypothetical protein n=1 Tax=Desulfotruncus alcoholivorax TaxID=265477 RepID=UPI0004877D9E|nr:hypothetical protein [Desulfotruncus alcoholivorax]
MRKNIILLTIITLIVAGCSVISSNSPQRSISTPGEIVTNVKYTPPKYNPNKSITYNKPYSDLKDELLYARITTGDDSTGRKTISYIKDNKHLVQIVQEFDKLKSSMPQKYCLDPKKQICYVVTIWREGTSVSYVIMAYQSDFYYLERPNLGIRKMPEKLVKLLGF